MNSTASESTFRRSRVDDSRTDVESSLSLLAHTSAETRSIDPDVTLWMQDLIDLNPRASVTSFGHTLIVAARTGETLTLPSDPKPGAVSLN